MILQPAKQRLAATVRRHLAEAYQFYTQLACPCAFPRFIQLVSFDFHHYRTGPVACYEAEMMIARCTDPKDGCYKPEADWIHVNRDNRLYMTCSICKSRLYLASYEFSGSMGRRFLKFTDNRAERLGSKPAGPVPLVMRLYGFNQADVRKCREFCNEGTPAQMLDYLTAVH